MGYIGNNSTVQNFTPTVDYFNGNGSTTSFTLSRTVGSAFDIQAFIENVPQNPSSAFTVAGNIITFTSAPPSGTNNIYVRYTSPVTQLVKPAPGTVGTTEISSSVTLTTPLISGNLNFDSTGTSGIRLPSANTLAFHTTGTEDMRIDSAGRVGIGTTSPYLPLNVNGTNSNAPTLGTASGSMLVANADRTYGVMHGVSGSGWGWIQTQRVDASAMAYDLILQPSGGNVGIGTTGPSSNLTIQRASAASSFGMRHTAGGNGYGYVFATTGTTTNDLTISSEFNGSPTERMRISSGGNLLVGATSAVDSERINVTQSGQFTTIYSNNTNATNAYGIRSNLATYFFNTTSFLFDGIEFSNLRFRVYSNGGIGNYSGNDVNLSDQREKKNIELAPNYLNKICQIPVKTFLYVNQTDTQKTLGVVAQDVQAIAPELVDETDWSENADGSKMRLSIYQTDLQYALMKSIQEQQAIIENLKARIEVLEAK